MKIRDSLIFQIAETSELVGELEDLSTLQTEYASDDHIYQAKIQVINKLLKIAVPLSSPSALHNTAQQDLKAKYTKLRRTRGDGNCFFRAFSFAYMESLLKDNSDLSRCVDP